MWRKYERGRRRERHSFSAYVEENTREAEKLMRAGAPGPN
jgi:hypothetical protein